MSAKIGQNIDAEPEISLIRSVPFKSVKFNLFFL